MTGLILNYSSSCSSVFQYILLGRLFVIDKSADLIYSSHFLEHIPSDKVESFLLEYWRILRPCGMSRLVVPGLVNHAIPNFTIRVNMKRQILWCWNYLIGVFVALQVVN